MIVKYSKKKDGDRKITRDFRVREFACRDGSDTVYVDSALADYLQRIRNWACAPVRISSGYRTPAWNKKVGGSSSSYHTKGRAADIIVSGKSIYSVAKYAQAIGVNGVERNDDSNYVHIDTRPGRYYWIRSGGRDRSVSTFGGSCPYEEPKKTLRRGNRGDRVRWLQFWLRLWDEDIEVDGSFGKKTESALRDIQEKRGLTVDGLAGKKTRAALKGF